MLLVKIILITLFTVAAVKAIFQCYKGRLSRSGLFYWIILWLSAGVIVAWPNSTSYFAKIFGIGRGVDLVVYLSLVLIFFLIFRLIIVLEKQKKEITKLTQELALLKNKNFKF